MQVDMRVLEMLSSKICHDLVSPISAINNGVELIEDIGGSVVEEAMKLIGDSANHAARRVKLFRMAYGRAGSEENLGLRDVKLVAEQYIAGGKVALNWGEGQPSVDLIEQRGFLKTVLNLIVLAEEVLPYGGAVTLRSPPAAMTGENEACCRFEIVGRAAQLSPQLQAALDGTAAIDDLTPRSIQAYMVGRYAMQFGLRLRYDQSIPDRLDLNLFGARMLAAA